LLSWAAPSHKIGKSILVVKRSKQIRGEAKGDKCPECGSDQNIRNGGYGRKNLGFVQRYLCKACKHTWSEFANGKPAFADARIFEPETVVLQTFALVAMGLPLFEIEGLMDRKSETIQSWLLRCFSSQSTWEKAEMDLGADYSIQAQEIAELRALLEKVVSGKATFHAQSRRARASQVKGRRRYGKPSGGMSEERFREMARLYQLSPEHTERFWRERQKHPAPKVTERMKIFRNKLRERIANVLRCQIVVTPTGEFYRAEDDHRVARWLAKVRQSDDEKTRHVRKSLSYLEKGVFDQVRCANEQAHFYAKLEGSRGLKYGGPWLEKMTPDCLARGLGLELGQFIAILKSVADSLLK
jgi:transposase-like protein